MKQINAYLWCNQPTRKKFFMTSGTKFPRQYLEKHELSSSKSSGLVDNYNTWWNILLLTFKSLVNMIRSWPSRTMRSCSYTLSWTAFPYSNIIIPEGNLHSRGKSKNISSSMTPLPNLISLSLGSTSKVASAYKPNKNDSQTLFKSTDDKMISIKPNKWHLTH